MGSNVETYRAYCDRKAAEGFPTGWRCVECPLPWWPLGTLGAKRHADETGHSLVIGPAPLRSL